MKEVIHLKMEKQPWEGDLYLPQSPKAVVIFVHGSGSGRYSARNNFFAQYLFKNGFASFLFDLTFQAEKESGYFEVNTFSQRLSLLTEQLKHHKSISHLPFFFFGGSTGAAVAMASAANHPQLIKGIISRGGRVDLVAAITPKVKCPVLLIVGELDREVLYFNQVVFSKLPGKKELKIIPEAGHLFEEPGKLEEAAVVTKDWLCSLLTCEEPSFHMNLHF